MVQRIGDTQEQCNVNVVLVENLVHMGTGAANVGGQLGGRNALLSHDFLDMLPDVHKKRGIDFLLDIQGYHTLHNLTSHSTPCYTAFNNLSLIVVALKKAQW